MILLNPVLQPRADVALLLLSIQLVATPPSQDRSASNTAIYQTTKKFYSEVEAAGAWSIQVLQSGILISLYELGHAIYPSAYLSIGACARYGVAFEANGRRTSHSNTPGHQIEMEERNRAWWAVVILDRFENRLFECAQLTTSYIGMSTWVIQIVI